jgi:hypothetical protein
MITISALECWNEALFHISEKHRPMAPSSTKGARWRRPATKESPVQLIALSRLRQAAAGDVLQRRMSKRTDQRFAAIGHFEIGGGCARNADIERLVHGIAIERSD